MLNGLKTIMVFHTVCANRCVLLMACAKYTTIPGQSRRDTAIWSIWFPNFIFWPNNKGVSKTQLWSQNLFYFRFLHYLLQTLFFSTWYFSLDSSLFNNLLHILLIWTVNSGLRSLFYVLSVQYLTSETPLKFETKHFHRTGNKYSSFQYHNGFSQLEVKQYRSEISGWILHCIQEI